MLKVKGGPVMVTVNDILTEEEKQIIAEYEEALHKAWTKKGVDTYHQRINKIINQAKERYNKEQDEAKERA